MLSLILMLQAAPPPVRHPTPPANVLRVEDVALRSDPEAIKRYYPRAALQAGLSGWAYATCTIDTTGRLKDCDLARVIPADQGFEAATQQVLSRLKVHGRDKRGAVVTGRRLWFEVHYNWAGPRAYGVDVN